jgi:hypothetical protein
VPGVAVSRTSTAAGSQSTMSRIALISIAAHAGRVPEQREQFRVTAICRPPEPERDMVGGHSIGALSQNLCRRTWMPASMDVAVGFQGSIDFDMVMRGRLPLRVEIL